MRDGEVIDPVDEAGAGFIAHSLAEAGGLGGTGEELGQKLVDELLGARLGLPGELFEGLGDAKGHWYNLHVIIGMKRRPDKSFTAGGRNRPIE